MARSMTPCPNCGFANAEGVKFCAECGAQLVGPSGGPGEVRRTVSVLFADVSGSTALGERLDPESLRALMGRYFATMKGIVERHGGTVEKFIGDAVMAVFGIPTLHEDDALRAVRAAVDIRDTLAGLNEELQQSRGLTETLPTGGWGLSLSGTSKGPLSPGIAVAARGVSSLGGGPVVPRTDHPRLALIA